MKTNPVRPNSWAGYPAGAAGPGAGGAAARHRTVPAGSTVPGQLPGGGGRADGAGHPGHAPGEGPPPPVAHLPTQDGLEGLCHCWEVSRQLPSSHFFKFFRPLRFPPLVGHLQCPE